MIRFMLCILLATASAGSALAAKKVLTIDQAQTAQARGDANAAAALGMTTDQNTCLTECGKRGYDKANCTAACKPGFCHPGDDPPYCIGK